MYQILAQVQEVLKKQFPGAKQKRKEVEKKQVLTICRLIPD